MSSIIDGYTKREIYCKNTWTMKENNNCSNQNKLNFESYVTLLSRMNMTATHKSSLNALYMWTVLWPIDTCSAQQSVTRCVHKICIHNKQAVSFLFFLHEYKFSTIYLLYIIILQANNQVICEFLLYKLQISQYLNS